MNTLHFCSAHTLTTAIHPGSLAELSSLPWTRSQKLISCQSPSVNLLQRTIDDFLGTAQDSARWLLLSCRRLLLQLLFVCFSPSRSSRVRDRQITHFLGRLARVWRYNCLIYILLEGCEKRKRVERWLGEGVDVGSTVRDA
jgi:hypothetical protein